MRGYQQIQLCAFKLRENLPTQEYYVMKFNQEFYEEVKLLTEIKYSKQEKKQIPYKSLNAALKLIPGLIYIGKITDENWLYSPYEIEFNYISLIIKHWIEVEFRNQNKITDEAVDYVISLLTNDNFKWEQKSICFSKDFPLHDNNTANINTEEFILLPHFLATKICKQGEEFEIAGKKLQFYRCLSKENGAELFSYRPLFYTKNKKTYYYSITLNIKVIQVPFQPYPQIHITPGIRRWLSLENSKLSSDHASYTYIKTKPFAARNTNREHLTEYFLTCRLESKNKQLQWSDKIGKLLENLQLLGENINNSNTNNTGQLPLFPDVKETPTPEDILAKPEHFLHSNSSVAIVYKDGMSHDHKVGKGLPTKNVAQLWEQFTELFSDLLEPIIGDKKSENQKSDQYFEVKELPLEEQQKRLRQAIINSLEKDLTIVVFYVNNDNLKLRLECLTDCLGLPEVKEGKYTLPEGLNLTIITQEVGILGEKLNLNKSSKTPEIEQQIKAKSEQIKERINTIENQFSGKVGIWFELPDKDYQDWKNNRKADPKNAIRLGFADAGYVSQFITPDGNKNKDKNNKSKEKNEEETNDNKRVYSEKVRKSLIDLFRQLAVRIEPSNISLSTVNSEENINEVGLWLVNKTSKTTANRQSIVIPLMVKMSSKTAEIMAIFPGLKDWIPYDEALIKLNKVGQGYKNDDSGKAKTRTFIQNQLQRKELRNKPTILYCQAENIRTHFTWLKDGNINTNGISFSDNKSPENYQELRVIRVRNRDETPEWYGIDKGNKSGFTTGIFQNSDSERVFLSLGEKSAQMPKDTKDYETRICKIKNPSKHWNHPSILEITIAYCQDNDNFLELAQITHNSRHSVLQYQEFLEVPRVLHYAKQMSEYVLILEEGTEEETEE